MTVSGSVACICVKTTEIFLNLGKYMINSLAVFMVEKVIESVGRIFVAGFDKMAVNIAGGAGAGMTCPCGDGG